MFKPWPQQEPPLKVMLDQLVAWAGALRTVREARRPSLSRKVAFTSKVPVAFNLLDKGSGTAGRHDAY